MLRIIGILSLLVCVSSYAWNATGHQLIAQIAYDNLSPKARRLCNHYNRSLNKVYLAGNLVRSAIWLDDLRKKDVHWFDKLHYMDIPYTNDGSMLPTISEVNALWGINQALKVLTSSKSSINDKGISLRILLHVVGDIHQPLHTATLTNTKFVRGDLGGNLYILAPNPVANNLHAYWDKGAGVLIGHSTKRQLKNKAHQLELKWPCNLSDKDNNPKQWIESSHQIALQHAYTIKIGSIPDKKYQLNAQNISQKQIALAGCRLARLMNKTMDAIS